MTESRDVSSFDRELGNALAAMPPFSPLTHEILPMLRQAGSITADEILAAWPLSHKEVSIPGSGGHNLILSIFRPRTSSGSGVDASNSPGIFHTHAGGMFMMNRFGGVQQLCPMVVECNAVLVSVEYRLAPEHTAPAQLEDCYSGLIWMAENAISLGIDPDRIAIAGASAGGNLAAGVALMARDRGTPSLYAQLLMCPMLDNRNSATSIDQLSENGMWSRTRNDVAWEWYLGGKEANGYMVPALAHELSGLPSTFIDVGEKEIFKMRLSSMRKDY